MSEKIRNLFPKDMKYIEAQPIANYIEELQQENQQLKDKINTYENPEDLTLMFMYCDEKAKDKINQLKEVIEEVREYVNNNKLFQKKFVYEVPEHTTSELTGHFVPTDKIVKKELLQILDKAKEI